MNKKSILKNINVFLIFVIGLILFLSLINSASAENWYIKGGSLSDNNWSTTNGFANFWYEYYNAGVFLNLTSNTTIECSEGNTLGNAYFVDGICNSVPQFSNRSDINNINDFLFVHPSTEMSTLRFKPEHNAEYHINVTFKGQAIEENGNGVEVFVNKNSDIGESFGNENITLNDEEATYNFIINLSEEESIIFRVSNLGDTSFDSTGLILNISSRELQHPNIIYNQTYPDTDVVSTSSGTNYFYSFLFIPNSTANITDVTIRMRKQNFPLISLSIHEVNASNISNGVTLGNSTTRNEADISSSYNYLTFDFENVSTVYRNTPYLVVLRNHLSASNYVQIPRGTKTGYNIYRSSTSGGLPTTLMFTDNAVDMYIEGILIPIGNFTINAKNINDEITINNYSITINNTNYTTTNGSIETNLTLSEDFYNITFFDAVMDNGSLFFNETFNNVKINETYTGYLTPYSIPETPTSLIQPIEYNTNNLILVIVMIVIFLFMTFAFFNTDYGIFSDIGSVGLMFIGFTLLFSQWSILISLPLIIIPLFTMYGNNSG